MNKIAALALMFMLALAPVPLARADWNCQPLFAGVETICTDDAGRQVACYDRGQMAGKCVDTRTGAEVAHP
jgi:hypothetical protein